MSEYNIQMNKYNALNAEYDQLYPKPMKHANTHAKDGSDPITPASIGARPDTWVPTAADVGARPADWTPTAVEVGAIPTSASCNKNWNWNGQSGQPSWLWGGEDGTNMYVYNPSNFNVNYAVNASYNNYDGDYGYRLRNQSLVSSDTVPNSNGQIAWTYG